MNTQFQNRLPGRQCCANAAPMLRQCCLVLVAIFIVFSTSAQDFKCGTKEPEMTDAFVRSFIETRDAAVKTEYRTATFNIPLQFIITQKVNCETYQLTRPQIETFVAALNQANYFKRFIFYCSGVKYVNDDNTSPITANSAETIVQNYGVQNSINVLAGYINSIETGGFAVIPTNSTSFNPNLNYVALTNNLSVIGFAHEVGHYFGLIHTHNKTNFGNSYWTTAENVERNLTNTAKCNCNLPNVGDLLCSTNADPGPNINQGSLENGKCTDGCSFGCSGYPTDKFGDTYDPPKTNLMSYWRNCTRSVFTEKVGSNTDGQIDFMVNVLITFPSRQFFGKRSIKYQ